MQHKILQTEKVQYSYLESNSSHKINLRLNNKWITILENYGNYEPFLIHQKKTVLSPNFITKNIDGKSILLESTDSNFEISYKITKKDDELLHLRFTIIPQQDIFTSKIQSCFKLSLGDEPDNVWVPHIRPQKNLVIGDHVFRSPLIIYVKNSMGFALIPDLPIPDDFTYLPTFLDLNLQPNKIGEKPYVSYGIGNYSPGQHLLFKIRPKNETLFEKGKKYTIGFYLKVFPNMDYSEILQTSSDFLWGLYGRPYFTTSCLPQVVPFELNIKEGFKAIFERHEFWGDFDLNGIPCGGIWVKSYTGLDKHKKTYFDDLPEKFFDDPFQSLFIQDVRMACLWNNAWFMNVRTGFALLYFGQEWNDQFFVEKSQRILNTLQNLPMKVGVFPSVVFPSKNHPDEVVTINGTKAFNPTSEYNLVDCSLTMCWALRYNRELGLGNPEITERSRLLADFIRVNQLENGDVPSYYQFDTESEEFTVSDEMIGTANSAAMLMFLCEYLQSQNDDRYLDAAEKIASFLQKEIIPTNKWHDFEAFYSCTHLSFNAFDKYTKSNVMTTLCMYWAAEGFKELFKFTNESKFLSTGRYVLSVLSLFQQVWDMPHISINTFGGFCSQNSDGELNDSRSALFVRTFLEYYLLTGKQEYMERAISALRASWSMQLLREQEFIHPGNFLGTDDIDGIDRGVVYENYGHYGKDEKVSRGYIEFDWGVGSAASANAFVKRFFGDLFIDFKEKTVWGINGILVHSSSFTEDSIKITLTKIDGIKNSVIKTRCAPDNDIHLNINGIDIGKFSPQVINEGFFYKW